MERIQKMLELNDVNAGYGSFQALFDISLEVKAGEAVAVIGPNGAGKTTLMRVISGMTAPFSGALTMEGQSLGLVKPHEIVDLGIAHVPENRRLFPGMTVEDNLKLLMDEPSAGLAPVVVQQVFGLVKRIREEGYTVLIVEQNVQQVLKVADRAYLLEAGQLIESGNSTDLLASETVRKAYMGL
jgi:branched-chain amino acid transport system ATP-binding protein